MSEITNKMIKDNKTRGLFDEHFRYEKITKQKDPLLKLDRLIDWSIFVPILEAVFQKEEPKGKGGRPHYDYLLIFKILILQRYYNLSDDQIEYQILDRLSFMRFLKLTIADDVPDSKTIWLFRESVTNEGIIEKMFENFGKILLEKGFIGHEGKIVDASFVEVPRQRNTREENDKLKAGELPEKWDDNQNKLEQKDMDAKWTKKNGVSFYGYKNHVKGDNKSKLITKYKVTDASVHDSQVLEDLIEPTDKNEAMFADSAYSGEPISEMLEGKEVINKIHEKAYKNKPLTEEQKKSNKEKSSTRVRVEHIFGFVENSMNGSFIKSIGIVRATGIIGMMNITYNMFRYIQLCDLQGISVPIR